MPENYINGFSEKILIWGIRTILDPAEMMYPYSSGSTLMIFYEDFTKSFWSTTEKFENKNLHLYLALVCDWDIKGFTLFKILHRENGQGVHESYIIFSKKILVWGIWSILGPEMMHPFNSGSAL